MLQNPLRSTAVRGVVAALALAAVATPAHAQHRLLGTPVVQARSLAASSAGVIGAGRDASAGLLVPVDGISRNQLRDTYNQSRSEGRTHHAIDIHAPRGTPVVAVTDGTIVKLHQGARGGIAVYLLDEDGQTATTTRTWTATPRGCARDSAWSAAR